LFPRGDLTVVRFEIERAVLP